MSNLRTRAGLKPAVTNGGEPFEITTLEAEKFLSEKLEQIISRSNDMNEDIKLSLVTLTFGKKFKPFVALLPLSILKGKKNSNDEELSMFNPNSDSGILKIKDSVYKFLVYYMFNKNDSKMFFDRNWRSALGISETSARKLNSMRMPQTININRQKYVMVLLNPITVFHDMLVNIDNPGERFSVEEIRGERIDDKNFKYSMVRLPKNKKKNKKDEMDIAAELNRRLGNR